MPKALSKALSLGSCGNAAAKSVFDIVVEKGGGRSYPIHKVRSRSLTSCDRIQKL
ncbi:MAG: hypothetical protein ACYTX0_37795 [Nostoc sp.]